MTVFTFELYPAKQSARSLGFYFEKKKKRKPACSGAANRTIQTTHLSISCWEWTINEFKMKSDRTKAALLLCAVLSGAPLTAVHTVARDRRQVSTSALLHGAFFIVYQLIGFWFLAPAIVSPLQKKTQRRHKTANSKFRSYSNKIQPWLETVGFRESGWSPKLHNIVIEINKMVNWLFKKKFKTE